MITAVPALRLTDLRKTFRSRTQALRGLSLAIAPRECVTLLGSSGCGKTTTLRMIAGLIAPDSGTIEMHGQTVNGTSSDQRHVGFLAQEPTLFPSSTVAENLAFPLASRGATAAQQRTAVARILDSLGLAGAAGRNAAALSTLDQRLVALGQALVRQPELLLMDDPLLALDPPAQQIMRRELRRLRVELGLTVLLATARPQDALALSDRVAVMRAGVIEATGTPEAMYERPSTLFTAAALGDLNRLEGQVMEVEDGLARVRLAVGSDVEAEPAADLAPGQSCIVAIRPERIVLAPIEAATLAPHELTGRIIESFYLGDHYRLQLGVVNTAGEVTAELTITRPAAVARPGLAAGARAVVAWPAVHARAFPAAN
jgi:putative spermidine/putrescine transport system ATP-binding protein